MEIVNWLLSNAPAIIISLVAIVISVKSWYKTRIFYDLDTYQITGYGSAGQLKEIKDKLNTGKYTILNTYENYSGGSKNGNVVSILVGKIKK